MALSIRLKPGQPANLGKRSARGALEKQEAVRRLELLHPQIEKAHERLWARRKESVLVLLQGPDTAGKDRVIRRVFSGLIPQALDVHAFGPPSAGEAQHDFLWRYHSRVPALGRVGVFNRTWYEGVLVERVDHLVPARVIEARFGHIAAFERLLMDGGTRLLKIFLHLSEDEQAKRLRERRLRPDKQWKHNPDDLRKHRQYSAYRNAYREMLQRSTTSAAPWHIVPADHKPTRDLAVAELLLAALQDAGKRPKRPSP